MHSKVEIFLEQREVAFLNYFYFTGKHKENYRMQIYSLDGHVSIQFGVVVQLFTYKMVDNTMEFLLRTGVLLTVLLVKRVMTSPKSNSNLTIQAVISNVSRSYVIPVKNYISSYWS